MAGFDDTKNEGEFSNPTDLARPARGARAVTPADSDLTHPLKMIATRGLYIGTAGNVAVLLLNDADPVTFIGVLAGSILPLRVIQVRTTNTTASNIVALY